MPVKRKKKKKGLYDPENEQDMRDKALLQAVGLPVDRRYTRDQIKALEASPIEQIKRAGISFVTHRKKLEGSEEREIEATTLRRIDIKSSFNGLPDTLRQAVSDYQSVWDAAKPRETVSLMPRMSGGSQESDSYSEDDLKLWGRVRRQMNAKEARTIEQFLLAPNDAVMSTSQFFLVRSGAAKLAEFFAENSIE